MSSSLTWREARFVAEYARTRNAKQSALAAGYSPQSAATLGPRCLQKPHIVAALRDAGVEILHVARPPGQLDIGVGSRGADLFYEVLEPDHEFGV